MSEGRYVWRIAFQNFLNSFRPRQIKGNLIGKDYLGNSYFEIPPQPQLGKRKAVRWYDPPVKKEDGLVELPAEWESWLRMRRKEPPTEEEINKNLAVAEIKKIKGDEIEQKRLSQGGSLPSVPSKGQQSFPSYTDLPPGDPERFHDK